MKMGLPARICENSCALSLEGLKEFVAKGSLHWLRAAMFRDLLANCERTRALGPSKPITQANCSNLLSNHLTNVNKFRIQLAMKLLCPAVANFAWQFFAKKIWPIPSRILLNPGMCVYLRSKCCTKCKQLQGKCTVQVH